MRTFDEARRYAEKWELKAIKMYYSGASGRGAGNYFGMDKANVCNRIKNELKAENFRLA